MFVPPTPHFSNIPQYYYPLLLAKLKQSWGQFTLSTTSLCVVEGSEDRPVQTFVFLSTTAPRQGAVIQVQQVKPSIPGADSRAGSLGGALSPCCSYPPTSCSQAGFVKDTASTWDRQCGNSNFFLLRNFQVSQNP